MKRMRGGRRGFSLVEVTVASAIVAGMGLTFAAVLRTGLRGWQTTEGQITTSFELRRGIYAMARELAQTNLDPLGGQLAVPGLAGVMPAGDAGHPSVQFKVPEIVSPNTTVLDTTGKVTWSAPITYSLAITPGELAKLQRTQGAVVTTLAYGVIALNFKRLATPNNSVVEISVTVQRGTANGAQPVILSTRVQLRN